MSNKNNVQGNSFDEAEKEAVIEKEKECVERAKLLFDHQEKQYNTAVAGISRLEDKSVKIFSALNIIITVALLMVRYWWSDVFPGVFSPQNAVCWFFLAMFFIFVFISWGFTFSAMQLKERERPSSSPEMHGFYMDHPRYNSLTSFAKEYSRLTSILDEVHEEKVKLIRHCSESMLFGAWSFMLFFITLTLLKVN